MGSLILPEGCLLEKLNKSRHDREGFSCGEPNLEDWIRGHALSDQKSGTSVTHVLCDSTAAQQFTQSKSDSGSRLRINAFATLTGTIVPVLPTVVAPTAPGAPAPYKYPALLLAKMAVHGDLQGAGLGRFMVRFACQKALEQREVSGCRMLLVRPLHDKARSYYLQHWPFEDLGNGLLFLSMKNAAAVLA